MAYQQTTPPPVTFMQFATYESTKAASAVEKFTVVDANGIKFSVSMAPLTEADVASVLLHIWSYQNKTAGMTFTTFETEHELFGKTLTGLLMADWTAAVEAVPAGAHGLNGTIKLFIPKITMGLRECTKAFEAMKAILAKDALLRYPDHNKPFHVYADASEYQLGAVIVQDGSPVAYYSRKLNPAQRNYTTGEKEMLSIVETLKEYRSMLYGCVELNIYTDHKNLTFHNIKTQRVLRWRLYLEEYSPIFHYIKGESNTLADALSRLPICEQASASDPEQDSGDYVYSFSLAMDDDNLRDCLLSHPDPPVDLPYGTNPCPVDYARLAKEQSKDSSLSQRLSTHANEYMRIQMDETTSLICRKQATEGAPWRICIPSASLDTIILWYHTVMNHTGISRLHDTIATHFYHARLRTRTAELLKTCDACQRYKLPGKAYGHLPARNAEEAPWRAVAVDLIGPWKVKVGAIPVEFNALTVIDTVTNYPEVIRITNKLSAHIATQFENAWLCRYPCPRFVIYDQGGEFTGPEFQQVLKRHGIHGRQSTARNPQSNSIVERMHQTMANVLRPLVHLNPPQTLEEANLLVDSALQTTAYSARAVIHSTLNISPGALVFHRDMVLDIPLLADFKLLREKRQLLIDKSLMQANRKRIAYDYKVGDLVLKFIPKNQLTKLGPRAKGPFPIDRVHVNGTVTIRHSKYYTEHINIRHIKPYHPPPTHPAP
jgi:transposase InsO family protein